MIQIIHRFYSGSLRVIRKFMNSTELTILYDGGCPLCLREVRFLKSRDRLKKLNFVDIDSSDYDPSANKNISYRESMKTIHAITNEGDVIRNLEVFRRAYSIIGLGWIYSPTKWPILVKIFDSIYSIWAKYRLKITSRPTLEKLCECKVISPSDSSR